MTTINGKESPQQGQVYTLDAILRVLDLRDSPYLQFRSRCEGDTMDSLIALQTAHLGEDEMLTVQGFATTKWKFIRETDEWIPIFIYVPENRPIEDFVDVEKHYDDNGEADYWATPKGFPRNYI